MPETLTLTQLTHIQQNPELLIPPKFYKLVTKPNSLTAFSPQIWLGRNFDDQYRVPLSVLITEIDGFSDNQPKQEDHETVWGKVLNNQRQAGIQQGMLSEQDRVLASLLARDLPQAGMFVEAYIQAASLRRVGLGRIFYIHLENLLTEMGYKFLSGLNDATNLPFFLKLGRYQSDQLKPEMYSKLGLPGDKMRIPTIKFLDREFEELCVLPEFLRN